MMRDFKGVTSDKRIDLQDKSIVKYSSHGRRFEMLVNPEAAWLHLQGEEVEPDDIFEVYTVYENVSRGIRSSDDDLTLVFGDKNEREIALEILEKGELKLTQEQRNEIMKEKREEIVDFIHVHCINPRENSPIPKDRINNAIIDLGINIKYRGGVKEQAMDIIKQLQPIMPIRFESVKLALKIPASYAGSLYGVIYDLGEPLEEEWLSDGSLAVVVQIPSGMQADFLDEVTSKSKGKAQVRVLERLTE